LNGKMDEVCLWNYARTQQEISENMYHVLVGTETGLVSYWQFNEGTGTIAHDYVSGNDGTLTNMDNNDWVLSSPFVGFPGTALAFDGGADYVECGVSGSIDIDNEMTVEAWIKVPSTFPAGSRVGNIIGNYNHSPNFNFEVYTDGRLRLYWNGGYPNVLSSPYNMNDDTWHHVAASRNHTTDEIVLYIDGQIVGSATAGSNADYHWPLRIGNDFRSGGLPSSS